MVSKGPILSVDSRKDLRARPGEVQWLPLDWTVSLKPEDGPQHTPVYTISGWKRPQIPTLCQGPHFQRRKVRPGVGY